MAGKDSRRRRRGLTLVEVVATLGLLSLVVSVLATWSTSSLEMKVVHTPQLKWESAAARVLDSIQRDLSVGDFDPAEKKESGVVSGNGLLRIPTRVVVDGRVFSERWYEYRRLENTLVTALGKKGELPGQVALGEVEEFGVEIDEESGDVHVTLVSLRGQVARRTLRQ